MDDQSTGTDWYGLDQFINDQVQNSLAFYDNVTGRPPVPTTAQLAATPQPLAQQIVGAAQVNPLSILVIAAVIVGAVIVVKAV